MMLRPTRSTRTDPLVPDTTVFRSFQEALLALVAQERKTFLFVTHSIEEAVYVSDRIVLLSRRPSRVSQIVEPNIPRDGDPEDIRRNPVYLDTVEEIWQGLKTYLAGATTLTPSIFGANVAIPLVRYLLTWATQGEKG